MLTSNTTWISDAYKPRVIHSENQQEEVKAVVKTEKRISFSRQPRSRPVSAVIRRPSTGLGKSIITTTENLHPTSAKQNRSTVRSRVKSAPPRTTTTISKISKQNYNNGDVIQQHASNATNSINQVAEATAAQTAAADAAATTTTTSTSKPFSETVSETTTTQFPSSKPDSNVVSFYSKQIVTRTLDNAAFLQKNKRPIRPTSGRLIATRPLGKPRNAWGSSQELWYPASLHATSRPGTPVKDSNLDFTLYSSAYEIDNTNSDDNRSVLRLQDVTNRPHSSCSFSQQRSNHQTEVTRRAQSACSMRPKSPLYYGRSQTPEEILSPWMDDPRVGLNVGFQNDPALLYFDRHSRCHNHNHLHHPLLLWRPQPACTSALENCGNFDVTDQARPVSALSMRSQNSNPDRVQRYIDSHRPRTAPFTRKELQKHGSPGEQKSGYMPHYCNFVRSKAIHDRIPTGPTGQGSSEVTEKEDDVDDGYITNTELSPSLTDGSRKKSTKNKSTASSSKKSKADEDEKDGVSHAILRAESPTTSTGYDPESLFERLREHGLAGSESALNDSNIDDDSLASPHVNFDLNDVTDKDATHDVTTQTSSLDNLLSRCSTPAREPIQIPSIDANTTDLPPNNGTQSNKKDVNQLVNKLTNEQEVKLASQKPKRAPCVKKEKMPGKDRKKKGKKKGKAEEEPEVETIPEVTQVSEEANKGAPVDESGVPLVEAVVPDLPTLKTPAKDQTKSSKRKNKKLIGSPSKKGEKTDQPKTETASEPVKGFYDFSGIDLMANSALEDRTLAKASVKVPSYLNDRMVLSLQSSRFELPMDMKSLEKMSPQEYLKKHCVVSTRRKTLYNKMFTKYKEKAGLLQGKYLMRCLKDVLVNTITTDQVHELSRLLDVEESTQIDFPFFCGIAALAERIMYPQFLTEDTADCTEYQKEKVEVADFCSLEWKLNGVKVSNNIKQLLEAIS